MTARRWGFWTAATVGGAVLAALALLLASGGSSQAQRAPARGDDARRDVVLIMTDDQTVESMRVMPRTRRLLGDQGPRSRTTSSPIRSVVRRARRC
jgi:hypothetical protein